MTSDDKVTYFAETDSRNKRVKFGIKAKDRTRHTYVIGKTGMGKSTLLENMAVQDIQGGEGVAFIDPHGKTADLLLNYVPEHRIKDVVYFAPFDTDFPISFNIMEDVGYDKRHLVVSGLMSTFKKIWVDAWSARMEYILSNTLLALLEYPDATLLGVNKMLADKEYRKKVVDNITDPAVRSFWVDEFAKYTEKFAAEATPAIQNKIGQFTNNPLIRNIIGQPKSSFDIRKLMDERKILIINLSKGRVGDQNANLLGSMLITKIYLAAMSRADVSEKVMKTLPQFYLYVDEFQNFANESFADILSEARKYKLNLTIAHQYIEQMEEEVRAAVFGNVGTMIAFRVGSYDAEILEKEFSPKFTAEDIVNLGFAQIYLRLMIDGIGSQPFSATTLGPIAEPAVNFVPQILESSRSQFAQPRSTVEEMIKTQMAATVAAAPAGGPRSGERRPGDRPDAAHKSAPSSTAHNATPAAHGPAHAAPHQAHAPQPRRDTHLAQAPSRESQPRHDAPRPSEPRRVDLHPKPEAPRERPAPPPADGSDGFQSLKDLKAVVQPASTSSSSPSSPAQGAAERKGVTAESRLDLRAALASIAPAAIVKPTAQPKAESPAPKAETPPQTVTAPTPPPQKPPEAKPATPAGPPPVAQKPSSVTDVPVSKEREGIKEVPEHVLKKILEV